MQHHCSHDDLKVRPQSAVRSSSHSDWRRIDLSRFTCSYKIDRKTRILSKLWRLVGQPLLRCSPFGCTESRIINNFRVALLRLFGARVGRGVVIRPCEITNPWNVRIGDHAWIGEGVLLYSLAQIIIGRNACVSQRAFLCTGSHDISDPAFGLIVGEIHLKDGSWVCASAFIGPGVTLHEGAVAGANSSVFRDLPAMTVWVGNPCIFKKHRQIIDGKTSFSPAA